MSDINTRLSHDPFSRVERSLLNALFLHANLQTLVSIGNRVTFAGTDAAPVKENPTSADLPELSIVPAGGTMNPRSDGGVSSSSVSAIQRYLVGVATDEDRTCLAAGSVNAIKWRLFQAVQRLEDEANPAAVVGIPEIRKFRGTDFFDQLGQDVLPAPYQRVVEGWAFGLTIECLLVFGRQEMLA